MSSHRHILDLSLFRFVPPTSIFRCPDSDFAGPFVSASDMWLFLLSGIRLGLVLGLHGLLILLSPSQVQRVECYA
jgi:hypothetical protein